MSKVVLGTTSDGTTIALHTRQRSTHMQICGSSSRGKSKLVEHMIRQDILSPDKPGLCLIDPHGSLYNDLVQWCASERVNKFRSIHLINPSDTDWCFGFNPLRLDGTTEPSVRIDAMVNACAQVWGGEDSSRTPLLKKCLRAVFYSLAVNDLTLVEATEVVSAADPEGIRRYLTHNLGDRVFQSIWDDFNALAARASTRRQFVEQFSSTNNRLMEFLSAPTIRNIVGQRERVIDYRRCMENGDIVLVNLAPSSNLSLDNAQVIGALMVNDLLVTALGRDATTAGNDPFYLYIDECYGFLNNDIEKMLDQTRKFGLHLILIHQRLGQLREAGEGVYNAVMTGAQSKVIFGGLEAKDAEAVAANIFVGELDLEMPVSALDRPMPTGEFVRETLHGESDSVSEGTSEGIGITISEGEVLNADGETVSTSVSHAEVATEQRSQSQTHSVSKHEALRPEYRTMPSAVHGLDTVLHKKVVELVNQKQREAVVKVPMQPTCRITVPNVEEGFARNKRVATFTNTLLAASEWVSTAALVEAEITGRYRALEEKARVFLDPPEPEDDDSYLG